MGGQNGRFVRVRLSIEEDDLPEASAALRGSLAPLRVEFADDVRQADVFIGVYGNRYGTRDPLRGLSLLEQDYLAAGARPRLVYVMPESQEREEHLTVLLSRIRADDLASYRHVTDSAELARLVVDDLTMVLTEAFTGTHAAAPAQPPEPVRTRPAPKARIPAPWHRLVGANASWPRPLGCCSSRRGC